MAKVSVLKRHCSLKGEKGVQFIRCQKIGQFKKGKDRMLAKENRSHLHQLLLEQQLDYLFEEWQKTCSTFQTSYS
jgi:hypothetical protein